MFGKRASKARLPNIGAHLRLSPLDRTPRAQTSNSMSLRKPRLRRLRCAAGWLARGSEAGHGLVVDGQQLAEGLGHGPAEHGLSLIHISEPTRLGMISYAVFCLKKKNKNK